jgi:hypothetical protein
MALSLVLMAIPKPFKALDGNESPAVLSPTKESSYLMMYY